MLVFHTLVLFFVFVLVSVLLVFHTLVLFFVFVLVSVLLSHPPRTNKDTFCFFFNFHETAKMT